MNELKNPLRVFGYSLPGEGETLLTGFELGHHCIIKDTTLMFNLAEQLMDRGYNVICIAKDPWKTWLSSVSYGFRRPPHFVCGCGTSPSSMACYLQGQGQRIVILDIKTLTGDKSGETDLQAILGDMNRICISTVSALLVEEAALQGFNINEADAVLKTTVAE